MREFLAYPDEVLNKTIIDGVFEGLEIKEDDYLGNILRMSRHFNAFHNRKLREIVNPNDW